MKTETYGSNTGFLKRRGGPPETLFKKGNPGKPLGALNKSTILKDKLLSSTIKYDLDARVPRYIEVNGKMKKLMVREFPKMKLLELASGFVPKESFVKGEGFETNISIANILSSEEINPEARRTIITFLRKGRSSGQSV